MPSNLTTLATAKAWAGVTTTADDALLTRLIGAASRGILSHLQRPSLFQATYADTYDGSGSRRQVLRNWPVLSVTTLTVGTRAIAPSAGYGQAGYYLTPWDGTPPGRPQALDLFGDTFRPGHSNVAVSYTAGYVVQNEAWTIPASPYQVTAAAPYGSWAVDQGVTFTSGTALTPVSGTPAAGQYSVAAGVYTFAAADAGKAVLLSYSYVPADVEQACVEIVGERYKTKDRIGMKSKTLGGQETVAYDTAAMTDYAKALLQPFRKVTQL